MSTSACERFAADGGGGVEGREDRGLGVRGGKEPLKGDSERGLAEGELAGGVMRGRRMREKPVCEGWSGEDEESDELEELERGVVERELAGEVIRGRRMREKPVCKD